MRSSSDYCFFLSSNSSCPSSLPYYRKYQKTVPQSLLSPSTFLLWKKNGSKFFAILLSFFLSCLLMSFHKHINNPFLYFQFIDLHLTHWPLASAPPPPLLSAPALHTPFLLIICARFFTITITVVIIITTAMIISSLLFIRPPPSMNSWWGDRRVLICGSSSIGRGFEFLYQAG